VADADRRVAARNVEKCLIVAPFDAAVVERFAQVGARIAAGSPLLRLIELSPPEVEAAVQSEVAAELAGATEYWFERQGRRHPLRLLRMAPVVERAARTQVTRFAFVDAPAPAGSSGTLYWRAPGQSLPAALLVKRDEVLGFFTARDGRARFVPAPGALEGRPVAVDLPADTMLVVRGQQALNDGDAIVDRAPGA
jgi:multidrug efflux pump subunit AcrA (membrane-fusion protein)